MFLEPAYALVAAQEPERVEPEPGLARTLPGAADIAAQSERAEPPLDAHRFVGEQWAQLLPQLQYAHCAGNLGAVETIYGPARTTSHVEKTLEERLALGISEGLVRISVGIEEIEDLIGDLLQAFAHVRKQQA